MVEELAEEGHPRVEAGGQADVRRDVGHEEHVLVIGRAEHAIQPGAGDYLYAILEYVVITHRAEVEHTVQARVERRGVGRRVVGSLIDDQVTDNPWLRIDHRPWRGVCVQKRGIKQAREGTVRGAKITLAGDQVVEAAIDGTQAEWHLGVGKQINEAGAVGVRFCDKDLLEDELQVRLAEIGHFELPSICLGKGTGRENPPAPSQVLACAVCWLCFFARAGVTRDPGFAPGIRDMNCSPGDQAERIRALGGPWNLEVKANVLESPFPLQKNEMIDMILLLSGKTPRLALPKQWQASGGRPPR
ncbi:hypothetical protein EMIT0P258_100002 [Pseudomonas sp. IT-P258]